MRRTDKVDYGGYRGNGANGGGSYDSYAAYSAFSQAQTATVPHVWYHPGYAHAHAGVAAPQTYHHGELGEYIGGTWYPKQNGSESGLPDEAASNRECFSSYTRTCGQKLYIKQVVNFICFFPCSSSEVNIWNY